MEIMNGFVIIADAPEPQGTRVVLGARTNEHVKSGFEYVTAITEKREAAPTTWFWGHYFNELDEAVADFKVRNGSTVDV